MKQAQENQNFIEHTEEKEKIKTEFIKQLELLNCSEALKETAVKMVEEFDSYAVCDFIFQLVNEHVNFENDKEIKDKIFHNLTVLKTLAEKRKQMSEPGTMPDVSRSSWAAARLRPSGRPLFRDLEPLKPPKILPNPSNKESGYRTTESQEYIKKLEKENQDLKIDNQTILFRYQRDRKKLKKSCWQVIKDKWNDFWR